MVHQPAHGFQPPGDGHRVQQGPFQPAPQQTATHGGLGLVQHPQQGAFFLLAPQGLGQLQVPPGHRVQGEEAAGSVVAQGVQVGQVGFLGLIQVGQQTARRLDGRVGPRGDLIQPLGELALDPLAGLGQGEPALVGLLHPAGEFGGQLVQQGLLAGPWGEDDLPGGKADQLADGPGGPVLRGQVGEEDLPCGDVPKTQTRPLGGDAEGGQKVIFAFFEHGFLDEGAGGHHPDDLPVHQALGLGGVLGLLADGDLIALGHQAGDVGLGGVVGHAAHGGALLGGLVPVPGGEGQVEFFGGNFGVVVEHFIKIPQTEEQQAVGVLVLDRQILFFHGCQFCHKYLQSSG